MAITSMADNRKQAVRHQQIAELLSEGAKEHQLAAEYYEHGDHIKAAQHSLIADGHIHLAKGTTRIRERAFNAIARRFLEV